MGFAYETLGSIEAVDWSLVFYRVGGVYIGVGALAVSAIGTIGGAAKFRGWQEARAKKRPASAVIKERIRAADSNYLDGVQSRIDIQRTRIVAFNAIEQTFDQPGFSGHSDIEFQGMYAEPPQTPPEATQQ